MKMGGHKNIDWMARKWPEIMKEVKTYEESDQVYRLR